MNIFRYNCCGRTFILIDGRNISTGRFRKPATARMLCAVNEAEAIVIIESAQAADFLMSVVGAEEEKTDCAAMACAVAFADLLGLKPRGGAFTFGTADPSKTFAFTCCGKTYGAEVLTHFGESKMISLDGGVPLETICEGEL